MNRVKILLFSAFAVLSASTANAAVIYTISNAYNEGNYSAMQPNCNATGLPASIGSTFSSTSQLTALLSNNAECGGETRLFYGGIDSQTPASCFSGGATTCTATHYIRGQFCSGPGFQENCSTYATIGYITTTASEAVTCWDGSSAADLESCPVQPIDCWDGSQVTPPDECPVEPVDPGGDADCDEPATSVGHFFCEANTATESAGGLIGVLALVAVGILLVYKGVALVKRALRF